MKTLALVLLGVLFFNVSTVFAKEPPAVAVKLPENLKEVISEKLNYPKEAQDDNLEGDVWMKLSVADDSKISVIEISSTNAELGRYVKEELAAIYSEDEGSSDGQIYYLKVKFDLLMHE